MSKLNEVVKAFDGKWPDNNLRYMHEFLSKSCYGCNSYGDASVCTKQEFEAEAKRMGYINGFQWGVEYPTNGKKPDLPDDVFVELFFDGEWHRAVKCGAPDWRFDSDECHQITAFRITDERYKPTEQTPRIDVIGQNGNTGEHYDAEWHERGELPPVGAGFEVYWDIDHAPSWAKFECVYKSSQNVIFTDTSGKEYRYTPDYLIGNAKFRPLRTERERLVDAVRALDVAISYGQFDALYDAGLLRLPERTK